MGYGYPNKVREIRKDIGMPLAELARRSGTSYETMRKVELHGYLPNGLLVLRISEALKTDAREIWAETLLKQEKAGI